MGGLQKKSPKTKHLKKSKNHQEVQFWAFFLTFSGILGDFLADPPKQTLFEFFFAILCPEGPETPVNGRSGREKGGLSFSWAVPSADLSCVTERAIS